MMSGLFDDSVIDVDWGCMVLVNSKDDDILAIDVDISLNKHYEVKEIQIP
jgi:hypothetical protein